MAMKNHMMLPVALSVCMCGFRDDAPYLVDVLVYDETSSPVTVIEIWSDRGHVLRPLGPGELKDNKCGASVHCTNNEQNCSLIPSRNAGVTCEYCTSGTSTNNFCWPVRKAVCTTTQNPMVCGVRMRSTCVAGIGGNPTSCSAPGPTNQGTCTLQECV